jgi:hypothetical protein
VRYLKGLDGFNLETPLFRAMVYQMGEGGTSRDEGYFCNPVPPKRPPEGSLHSGDLGVVHPDGYPSSPRNCLEGH